MTVATALQIIEIGAGLVGEVTSGGVPAVADEVAAFAELIQKQLQVYSDMAGKPIDEVIAQFTYVDPDPTKGDQA